MAFRVLGLCDELVRGILATGYTAPTQIQLEAIHKIKGFVNAEMIRPGYAIEYDFFPPHQIDKTLETKLIKGL